MSERIAFSAAEAFERNLGLISPEEQERLAKTTIAIAGCGGVGGVHAHTLARLGIGGFRLCDPDEFSLANFNRQRYIYCCAAICQSQRTRGRPVFYRWNA